MPKYRGDYNPIDDPSLRDLAEGKDLADQIGREMEEIYALTDPIQWGEYGYPVSDPEQLLVAIEDIRRKLAPLPKPEQEQQERSIRTLAERVRRVYPEFVTDLVERYGQARSRGRDSHTSERTIQDIIQKATDEAENIQSYYLADYLVKIIDQDRRFRLFVKEPMYYVFEREARALETELFDAAYPAEFWNPSISIGDAGEAKKELDEKIETFQSAVLRLAQLAEEMHDPLVKDVAKDAIARAESLLKRFRDRVNEPDEYQPRQESQTANNLEGAYQLFGFLPSANPTKQEVTKRYLELAKINHPDIVGDEGTKRMANINAAMQIIRKTWNESQN